MLAHAPAVVPAQAGTSHPTSPVGRGRRWQAAGEGPLAADARTRETPPMALADERCVELNARSALATTAETAAMLAGLPDWSVTNEGGIDQLVRAFRFETFALALAFTNAVGEAAEAQGHHPRIVTEYGRVTVSWWTHFLGGLHRNDFIMAARTDALAQEIRG